MTQSTVQAVSFLFVSDALKNFVLSYYVEPIRCRNSLRIFAICFVYALVQMESVDCNILDKILNWTDLNWKDSIFFWDASPTRQENVRLTRFSL